MRSAIPKDLPEHLLQRLVFPTDSVVIENPAATAGSADTGELSYLCNNMSCSCFHGTLLPLHC